jgi:hypothetical protein
MNLNSEIILITAYTPSIDKQDNLRELVKTLKSFKYEVCLITHSSTPQDIIDRCDYFIFDKKNEVNYDLDIAYWIFYDTPRFRISHKQIGSMSTHIVPITRLVIGGLSYLKTLNYEKVYMMEYDSIVYTDEIFKKMALDLDNTSITSFYSDNLNNKEQFLFGPISGFKLQDIELSRLPTNADMLMDLYRTAFNDSILPVTEKIYYNMLWSGYTITWNYLNDFSPGIKFDNSRNLNGYGDKSYLFHCYDDKLHFFCSNNTNEHWKFDIIINGNNNQITVDSNTWKWIPLLNFNEVQNIKLLLNNTFIKEFDMQNQYDVDVILKWAKIEMQN